MRSRIASAALAGVMAGGSLIAVATPAQAKSFVVFEVGRAHRNAGMAECTQFVMERDGAEVLYFSVQPRIEKYVRTDTVRYRDSKGRVQTKKVEKWKAVGGTTNQAYENKTFGGRNQNAQVATGSFQNPYGAWTFRRHLEGHGKYRCRGFLTATVSYPVGGGRYALKDVGTPNPAPPGHPSIGPTVNTSHR